MAYITQADLLQRMTLKQLTQLTDEVGAGVPDPVIVGGILEEASGKVDGYCRNRYATPLQQSDEIAAIARDIAVYLVFSRRPQAMAESIRQRYEDAIALLKDISTAKASIDQPATATAAQSYTAAVALPSTDLTRFNDSNIQGFV